MDLTMVTVMDASDPAVRAILDEARALMERLDAVPFVAQLDALLGASGVHP